MTYASDSAYEECVVTFLDVLGFRNLMETRSGDEVARILNIFRGSAKPDENALDFAASLPKGAISEVHAEIVSDAVVRIRTTETSHRTGPIVAELFDLLHLQMQCIYNGILIRGATTLGFMHLNTVHKDPVFGPALVEAYQMEENQVHYPRIAVKEDVIERHRTDHSLWNDGHPYSEEEKHLAYILKTDEAGLYFIDYLWASQKQLDGIEEWFEFVNEHKALVKGALAKNPPTNIKRKYVWLKNYHNHTLERVAQQLSESSPLHEEINQLRIE